MRRPGGRHKRAIGGGDRVSRFVPIGAVLTLAASVTVAAAGVEHTHRRLTQARLLESGLTIETLHDCLPDRECLEVLETALREEWGPTALLGFDDMDAYAATLGRTTFVASHKVHGRRVPVGALQTVFVQAGGSADRLVEAYPTFADLTAGRPANLSNADTAVLLQLAVFEQAARGAGTGSILRNASLQLLPPEIKFALTTTPVDRGESGELPEVDLAAAASFTPAMRFHARGGATAEALLPGYKASAAGGPQKHGDSVAVMRYKRDCRDEWPTPKAAMRLRYRGPLRERLSKTHAQLQGFSAASLQPLTALAARIHRRGHIDPLATT